MNRIARKLKIGVRGSLDVEIEQTSVLPGGIVTGTVRLNVDKPIETQGLSVVFAGRERLRWDRLNKTDSGSPRDETFALHEEKIILINPWTTGSETLALNPGSLECSFAFELPDSLPESFTYRSNRIKGMDRVCIAIDYDVTASLLVDGFLKADLECVEPIEMRSLSVPPIPNGDPVTAFKKDENRLLGFIKQGACDVNMNINSDVLDATSTIVANVDIAHSSKRELQSLRLSLVEDIEVDRERSKHIKSGSRVICSRLYEEKTLEAVTIDPAWDYILHLPVTPNDVYEFEPLLPSMSSHFIVSLKYRVVLECKFPMGRSVEVDAPVTVSRIA
ncbi:hypothetical protein Poli38472_010134 [Pythium oligandrum]|uniref:Arrestin-like N-terminal domain-containing protein n=1 Tax=Pythium oligandrum TaxID=41045 RepID=A0A8K1FCQ5_PYTOL|nr:hypothetical protein Poli38472_010134 [Pythium oligandrum]|eukprot:TMW58575.1 hypothetical protein Poli38472_010134 [Pythium oligandrum]